MNIIFFGTSQFAIPILDALVKNNLSPILVVTTSDRPQGRGKKIQSPPVKIWAQKNNIPIIQPENINIGYLRSDIKYADLFIVASYGKIIPKALLDMPKYGSLNVHPSLLPKYRGPSPIQTAILAGDRETGVTIMLMDGKVDHGPILKISNFQFQILKQTYGELERNLAELGARLLIEIIPGWVDSKIKPIEQNHNEATYTKKITKEDGHINWKEPAEFIEKKVRAYWPYPGTYTFWDKNGAKTRLKIIEVKVIPKPSDVSDGEVFQTKDGFAVGTPSDALEIIKTQPEGKKEMPALSFLNGRLGIVGAHLN